jgi:hypothetical protein
MRPHLLLGGEWQVRRFGEWLAHAVNLPSVAHPGLGRGRAAPAIKPASVTTGGRTEAFRMPSSSPWNHCGYCVRCR